MKEQCGVIFGSCARWQCPADSVNGRPWCARHEILTPEQQRDFAIAQKARGDGDDAGFVTTLVKWRRKLLQPQ